MTTDTVTDHKIRQRYQVETCCPVVELRQYALHPGKRETLIELFDRHLIESQEAAGMRIIGQFRDLDDPDSFVWLRGFPDMPTRARALRVFYEGPTWKKHREAANATMIDSGNVLLLRPARAASGFARDAARAAGVGGRGIVHGLIAATIYYTDGPAQGFTDFFEHTLEPVLREAGAACLAAFVTENSRNNYPALPVREGEQVFAWFARFESPLAYAQYEEALRSRSPDVLRALEQRLRGRPDRLRLSPTSRSALQA